MNQERANRLRRFYPNIHARLTAPFLVVVIIIAAVSVFTITQLVAGSIQQRFNNQLADSASAATNTIVDTERQQLEILRLIVFTDGMSGAVASHNTADLETWLGPIAINQGVHDIIIFDIAGKGIFRLRQYEQGAGMRYESEEPPDVSAWPGVQRVITGQADRLGDKFVDIQGEAPNQLFYISAPVISQDGFIVGGVSVGLRVDVLVSRIRQQALSAVILYNEDGSVLASSLQRNNPQSLAISSDLASDLSRRVETSSAMEETFINTQPYQFLYSRFQLRSHTLGLLAVALPSNFIVESSSDSRNTIAVLFSFMFAGVATLGLITARSITRPVAQLVETTRAIRDGDLSRRVNLQIPDELGELGVSFDHMTETLVKQNAEISSLFYQQLQETARRQAVLASISDAVIVLDLKGNIFLHNATADRLLTLANQQPTAYHDFTLILNQPSLVSQARLVQFGGEYFSVLATPVCLESGELLGYVVVFRDVTALIEAEQLKDDIMLQMSHELRTPLTAALGYVELIPHIQPNISPQTNEFLTNAYENLNTLQRMVNQVVDVGALLSNRLNLSIKPLDLAEELSRLVAKWQGPFLKRDLRLSLLLTPQSLPLEGDPEHLTQVFDHLLRNAYSYTMPGNWVEIRGLGGNDLITVIVSDGGVGIHEDELGKVFDRMYRGRSADAGPTDARGLGLGLYIASEIVHLHQGTIQLESQREIGTTITVRLPIRQN